MRQPVFLVVFFLFFHYVKRRASVPFRRTLGDHGQGHGLGNAVAVLLQEVKLMNSEFWAGNTAINDHQI